MSRFEKFDVGLMLKLKHAQVHQKRSTTGRYHVDEAVYGSTRKHNLMTDLGNHLVEDRTIS